MKTKFRQGITVFLLFTTLGPRLATAFAQGTAFNYNGQLNVNGSPANGSYDLTFTLFATNSSGSAVAEPVTNSATGVTNGLFTATIDFGTGVFTGSNYWLQVAVRTNGSGSFTNLSPRQPILPTPYAIYSASAGNAATANTAVTASSANSVAATNINGMVPLAELPAAVVTNDSASVTIGGTNVIAPLTLPPHVPAVATGSAPTGTEPESIALAGRYAYVVNDNDGTLQVFDVSTPSAPGLVVSALTEGFPSSVAVAGRYAYVLSDGTDTLQIMDISNPSSPINVGDVVIADGTVLYNAVVAVAGRYAYVVNEGETQGVNTLQVIDVGNPAAPVSVSSVNTAGYPNSVAVAGRYAYVVNDYPLSTLQIFDVNNPSAPVSVGSVSTGGFASSVAVAGRYAYVATSSSNTLQIIDVSNPTNPVPAGSVTIVGGQPVFVAVAGRYAYVLNNTGMLQIVDVGNPSAPVGVGSVGTGDGPSGVAVVGRYAYVVNQYSPRTLQVFDLGGAYIQQLEAGAMETGTLQTRDTVTVGNNLDVRGGFTASGSARISGGLSVDNGTISATNFSGNGSGLTNLNASSLSGSVPVAVLTSVPATNLTGTVSLTHLPANVLTNSETGVTLSGTFGGNGGSLTNLKANAITGGITTNIVIGGHTYYYTNGVLINFQ